VTDEIVFYHWPRSRSRVVHWMLEEIGVPYRVQLTNLERGEHKHAQFLAINPMGKLPALVHRGSVITETGAILTFLADQYPAAGLAPPIGEPSRGAYLRWMFFGAACVDPSMIDHMLKRPEPEHIGAIGYGRYEHVFDVLEQALTAAPYLLGERFSAADLYVGAQIGFGLMMKALEPRPAFQAYLARITARPAHARALAQGEAMVAGAKTGT
jgi:glutathione S-transferase